jgi:hypothetical protein
MGTAVTGQQAGAGADMGAGQFQISPTLAGLLTVTAPVNVAAIAMPLELGFREIGHDVVVELAGRFKIAHSAMRTLLGMDVVFNERRTRRRVGPKGAWMLAVFLSATVRANLLGIVPAAARALAALLNFLKCVLHLTKPTPQLGVLGLDLPQSTPEGRVLRFQFNDPSM